MQNNIVFYDSTLEDGGLSQLPTNLANFRALTLSEIEKREQLCKLVGIMLNYHLGWHLTEDHYNAAVNRSDGTQLSLEKLKSIKPIKYTATFRLSPGEAKRVAKRLVFTPLIRKQSQQAYWARNNRHILCNAELLQEDTGAPATIINKYKRRGSRNNYRQPDKLIHINHKMWDLESDEWQAVIDSYNNGPVNFRNEGDSAYYDIPMAHLIQRAQSSNGWQFRSASVRCTSYSAAALAADLFGLFKDALKSRRLSPEITYSDEDDFTELRTFLEKTIEELSNANKVLKGMAIYDKSRLIKTNQTLRVVNRIILKKPGIEIRHPDSTSEYPTYFRQVQDIQGRDIDFIVAQQTKLNVRGDTMVGMNAIFTGYTDVAHQRPNLYCIYGRGSTEYSNINAVFSGESTTPLSNHLCMSEYESSLKISARNFRFISLGVHLLQWHKVYVPTRTNPFDHPGKILFGIPNDIPEWYKSMHDSDVSSCRNLILNNYTDTGSGVENLDRDDARGLLLNHCANCMHRESQDECITHNQILDEVYGPRPADYYKAELLAFHKLKVESTTEDPAPAVETVTTPVEAIREDDFDTILSNAVDEVIESRSVNIRVNEDPLTAEAIDTSTGNQQETTQERTMRLMSQWALQQ